MFNFKQQVHRRVLYRHAPAKFETLPNVRVNLVEFSFADMSQEARSLVVYLVQKILLNQKITCRKIFDISVKATILNWNKMHIQYEKILVGPICFKNVVFGEESQYWSSAILP